MELDGYRDITQRENLILQANLIGEFSTGSVDHTLLFGIETGRQDTENYDHHHQLDEGEASLFSHLRLLNV